MGKRLKLGDRAGNTTTMLAAPETMNITAKQHAK